MNGQIWRAVSLAPGQSGIGGPYRDMGIILQPDAASQPWEGQQGTDSFYAWPAGGKWYGFYGSHNHCPLGPWLVGLAEAPAALARYSESLAPLVTAAAPFLGHRPDDPQRLIARLGDLESLLLARLGAAPPVPRASSIPHAASSTWAQGKGEDARPHEV